ncbi:MAG: hypothetical protein UR25_C0001G0021 [Candidatus Nomurabacteria bacterium GW2011_GWE1_32_28]|uniref:Uncharacterized protein n=1 Tax=Candidatus Nomurabacteria bacterium GW2011_GWF1_31_48 TaxID=1618767 RepID=A0A0F9YE35_9BACT|nr:MAG: hypothetical protein UR10_C0005G0027 [Candidatus Nomurabacteria bacterium GW2011_GWF2_30_133]KKP28379.1 MAG: hypothetical protein UR18_C0005G0027 [Candidatus Nomurabacteria bacterium GW2011_GWE2_31_40]KKP29964.1 MAG: hypothetical protein UR19_C0006G0027 [Candidatus Nomurabacteria bacterium GW2011_GWF1_31_48]KKP35109.1 MAG: hypothetical protein UR25_C0001G0021 [Candidatus Nomurabacteria bacterium GW2011_GWE1_32_28]HAS80921.1 hypothetical protein [Candidatus Nomurabacteria bacterium]
MKEDFKNVIITFGLIAFIFMQGSSLYQNKIQRNSILALQQEKLQIQKKNQAQLSIQNKTNQIVYKQINTNTTNQVPVLVQQKTQPNTKVQTQKATQAPAQIIQIQYPVTSSRQSKAS